MSTPASGVRRASWREVAVLVPLWLAGCAGVGQGPARPDLEVLPDIRPDYRVEPLRARLREYAITFAARVDLTATSIERRAPDAVVARNALLWKLRAIPEMRQACFRPEPVGALIDAWTFVRQMDQFFREGAGVKAFGPLQPEALEVSGRLVGEMREITDSIAVSPDARVRLERQIVDPWLAAHPLGDLSFVRESPLARFAEQSAENGNVLQSVGTIEDVVSSLSQQVRIQLADLPRQIRGEIDLLRADALPPDLLPSLRKDLHVAAEAANSIASTAETVPELVARERAIVLDEVSRQRAMVLTAISIERERAVEVIVRAFAAEREHLLRDIDVQRRATLEWATAERRAAIAELRAEVAAAVGTVRSERAAVAGDLRQLADLVLLRLALGLIAAVVLAPLVAHVYARVWPRRSPS